MGGCWIREGGLLLHNNVGGGGGLQGRGCRCWHSALPAAAHSASPAAALPALQPATAATRMRVGCCPSPARPCAALGRCAAGLACRAGLMPLVRQGACCSLLLAPSPPSSLSTPAAPCTPLPQPLRTLWRQAASQPTRTTLTGGRTATAWPTRPSAWASSRQAGRRAPIHHRQTHTDTHPYTPSHYTAHHLPCPPTTTYTPHTPTHIQRSTPHTCACHARKDTAARPHRPPPQGFARVPRCDDGALMEALYSRGPLAISFDASRPSFRFFSSGVYVDTEVRWGVVGCGAVRFGGVRWGACLGETGAASGERPATTAEAATTEAAATTPPAAVRLEAR